MVPLALPPPPGVFFTFLAFFSLLGVSLLLPDDDTAGDGRRDLEDDLTRPLPPVARLLFDVADGSRRWRPPPPPPPPSLTRSGPRPSLLLFPETGIDEREPREPVPLECPLECPLSLAGVAEECLALAVPRGTGGARPTPPLPPLPPGPDRDREERRGLAGVVPEELLEERRDLAGVTPWMSPSDPELDKSRCCRCCRCSCSCCELPFEDRRWCEVSLLPRW